MTRCPRCHGASGAKSGQFDMEAELGPGPFSFTVLKDAYLTQKGQCDLP